VRCIECACRYSEGEPSIVGYGVTGSFPLFPGDGTCDVGIAAASFGISPPLAIGARGALTLGDLVSCLRVDDDADLMMSRSCCSYGDDVVDTSFVGGVTGDADER
jgi:hypothetical protein